MVNEERPIVCRVHKVVHVGLVFQCQKCRELAAERDVIIPICPNCGESLLVPEPLIEGLPPVRLQWQNADEFKAMPVPGILHVSSRRGSTELESNPPIRKGEVLRLSCPHCLSALPMAPNNPECRLCGKRVVKIVDRYPRGKELPIPRWVCSQRGCPGHHFNEENNSVGADIGLDGHLLRAMAQGGFAAERGNLGD